MLKKKKDYHLDLWLLVCFQRMLIYTGWLTYLYASRIKDNDNESNAFSKSISNNKPGILFSSTNGIKSYSKRVLSPKYLPEIGPD